VVAKGKSDIEGLTSLFESKNGGRVGSISGEYLERLIKVVTKALIKGGLDKEKAMKAGKYLMTGAGDAEVVFFCKVWKRGEKPRLSAGPGDPSKKRGGGRKKDDFDDDFGGEPEDDGFGGSEEEGIDFD
jgi:hypothetical protein